MQPAVPPTANGMAGCCAARSAQHPGCIPARQHVQNTTMLQPMACQHSLSLLHDCTIHTGGSCSTMPIQHSVSMPCPAQVPLHKCALVQAQTRPHPSQLLLPVSRSSGSFTPCMSTHDLRPPLCPGCASGSCPKRHLSSHPAPAQAPAGLAPRSSHGRCT